MTTRPARGVILLYHSVAISDSDPQYLRVDPHMLQLHTHALADCFNVVPLPTLVKRARSSASERLVSLSFDDGYADNFEVALPILREASVPATIFVASGPLVSGQSFWWAQVERLVLTARAKEGELRLCLGGEERVWEVQSDAPPAGSPGGWRIWQPPQTWRHALFIELLACMRRADERGRCEVIDQLGAFFDGADAEDLGVPLTVDQLTSLAREPLIDIGAHTVSHPVLSLLPPAQQRLEIQQSRLTLQRLTGFSVEFFAYPYGAATDFTTDTRDIVGSAGFSFACSTVSGTVTADADLMQLPRVAVADADPDSLVTTVSRLLEDPSVDMAPTRSVG